MEYQEILQEQFNNVVDEDSINSILSEAGDITGGLAQQFSAENILNATMEGRSIFDDPAIVENLKELFFLEIKSALLLCVEILSICIIIGVLKGLSGSFNSKSVSDISMLVCSMVIVGISINNFRTTYTLAIDSVTTMANTMGILMPIMAVTGLLLVVLTGIISIQGLLTDTSDGLLLNTAKFSLSNFIPIVGGFTSDTVELFLRCMSSIKSVVGVFGIILILLLLLSPLLKVLVIAVIYKITAALAEPITDSKIAASLSDMGSCMISIGSIMFFTALLFIMFITTIIKIGGG